MAANDNRRPVMDEGEPYRQRPYHAGGPQGDLSGRKAALLNTGTVGRIQARSGQASHAYEAPLTSYGDAEDDELEPGPRPMPHEIPVSSQTTHAGNIVRYLDGHSEIHRERPGLVEMLHNPNLAHLHDEIRDEVKFRDAVHNHTYW